MSPAPEEHPDPNTSPIRVGQFAVPAAVRPLDEIGEGFGIADFLHGQYVRGQGGELGIVGLFSSPGPASLPDGTDS